MMRRKQYGDRLKDEDSRKGKGTVEKKVRSSLGFPNRLNAQLMF